MLPSAQSHLQFEFSNTTGWHLQEIAFRIKGMDYPSRGGGIFVPQGAAPNNAYSKPPYHGPINVWCGEGLNHSIKPYYPVVCGSWDDFHIRMPSSQLDFVPDDATQSESVHYLQPDTRSIEFNFRDADAPARSPVNVESAARAKKCQIDTFTEWRSTHVSDPSDLKDRKLRQITRSCQAAEKLPSWAQAALEIRTDQ